MRSVTDKEFRMSAFTVLNRGFKQSGLGRELGPDALDAFTETKNVFIATED